MLTMRIPRMISPMSPGTPNLAKIREDTFARMNMTARARITCAISMILDKSRAVYKIR
jgi:hypothetical protein